MRGTDGRAVRPVEERSDDGIYPGWLGTIVVAVVCGLLEALGVYVGLPVFSTPFLVMIAVAVSLVGVAARWPLAAGVFLAVGGVALAFYVSAWSLTITFAGLAFASSKRATASEAALWVAVVAGLPTLVGLAAST